jgi:hypothetical protein
LGKRSKNVAGLRNVDVGEKKIFGRVDESSCYKHNRGLDNFGGGFGRNETATFDLFQL